MTGSDQDARRACWSSTSRPAVGATRLRSAATAYREALEEIAKIEVEIAADRARDDPAARLTAGPTQVR